MTRPSSRHPTELELQILKIFWRKGSLTVREVCEALAPTRKRAYTSVMTIMTIMTDKGYLARTMRENSYVYRARIGEKATQYRMLANLVERAFDGSSAAAMLRLLGTSDLDARELAQLRKLIDEKFMEAKLKGAQDDSR